LTDFDQIAPRPQTTIEAIRSIGYSFSSAIADIVDNSLPVNSSVVEVFIYANGVDSWCAIVDDGDGMSEEELREAMRIGSGGKSKIRNQSDLGRFGIGLKSAGFSQARVVSVISKRIDSPRNIRVWDLDHLGEQDDWVALKSASSVATKFADERLKEKGTIVFLEKLDGSLKVFNSEANSVEIHKSLIHEIQNLADDLSKTFGHFISKNPGFTLRLNGTDIEPWVPFFDHPATQELPSETILVDGASINCRAYVLPHPDLLNESNNLEKKEYREALYDAQGFYLYRNDRLISGGTWIDKSHRRENETSLARIEVDVPSSLDDRWELTVDKTTFRPTKMASRDLKRIAELTRGRSREVYRNRGIARPLGPRRELGVTPLIVIGTKRGSNFARLNEKHPLVQQLFEMPNRRLVRTFIDAINESMTRSSIRPSANTDPFPNDEAIPNGIRECATYLFEQYVTRPELTRQQIRELLLTIDPLSSYPSVVDEIVGNCNELQ